MAKTKRDQQKNTICFCNFIKKETIENCIRQGAESAMDLFDACGAGVGPCGGTCRPYLVNMIETYKKTGEFPENPRPKDNRPKF